MNTPSLFDYLMAGAGNDLVQRGGLLGTPLGILGEAFGMHALDQQRAAAAKQKEQDAMRLATLKATMNHRPPVGEYFVTPGKTPNDAATYTWVNRGSAPPANAISEKDYEARAKAPTLYDSAYQRGLHLYGGDPFAASKYATEQVNALKPAPVPEFSAVPVASAPGGPVSVRAFSRRTGTLGPSLGYRPSRGGAGAGTPETSKQEMAEALAAYRALPIMKVQDKTSQEMIPVRILNGKPISEADFIRRWVTERAHLLTPMRAGEMLRELLTGSGAETPLPSSPRTTPTPTPTPTARPASKGAAALPSPATAKLPSGIKKASSAVNWIKRRYHVDDGTARKWVREYMEAHSR